MFFEKPDQHYEYSVCYLVWNRIKTDSRFIETPDMLKKQIRKLFECANNYTKEYDKLLNELNETINRLQENITLSHELRFYSASYIIDDVLEYREIRSSEVVYSFLFNKNQYSSEDKENIDMYIHEINKACQKINQIDVVRGKRDTWRKSEEQTIALLANMIQYSILEMRDRNDYQLWA